MKIGDKYRHYKGYDYIIENPDAMYEPNQTPVVIYRSVDTGKVWVRPKASFLSEVVGNGLPKGTKRFTPII